MKKYMITFGNEKFKNPRERIVRECKELNIFNECKFYNENYVENFRHNRILFYIKKYFSR